MFKIMFLQTCEKEKRKCSNKTVENRKLEPNLQARPKQW